MPWEQEWLLELRAQVWLLQVCTYACRFCAFSKGRPGEEAPRGLPYVVPLEEISRWAAAAAAAALHGS